MERKTENITKLLVVSIVCAMVFGSGFVAIGSSIGSAETLKPRGEPNSIWAGDVATGGQSICFNAADGTDVNYDGSTGVVRMYAYKRSSEIADGVTWPSDPDYPGTDDRIGPDGASVAANCWKTDAGGFGTSWNVGDLEICVLDKTNSTTGAGYTTAVNHVLTGAGDEYIDKNHKIAPIPQPTMGVRSGTSVPMSWSAINFGTEPADNMTGYRIYRNSTTEPTFVAVGNVSSATLTFTDTIPDSAATYWYRLGINYAGKQGATENWATNVTSLSRSLAVISAGPPPSNNPPTLSGGGVTPGSGTAGITSFTYNVTYKDTDNNPPAVGYPKVNISKGVTLIGNFAMTWQSGANNTGANYRYSTTLSAAGTDYTFKFNASDSVGAWAAETSIVDNPDVIAAGTTGSISGTVYKNDGSTPIEGATVTVVGTSYSNATGSGGTYTITGVPGGTYNVIASKTGYESDTKTGIVVTAGQTTSGVDFTLTPVAVLPTLTMSLLSTSGNNATFGVVSTSSGGIKIDDITWKIKSGETLLGSGICTTSGIKVSNFTWTDMNSDTKLSTGDNLKVDAGAPGNYNLTAVYSGSTICSKEFTITGPDTEAPVIIHTPVTSATENEKITITATITDNIGLTAVSVFYRTAGAGSYTGKAMTYVSGDVYTVDIPASAVTTAGVEYYIWAKDGAGNEATNGTAASPHSVDVSAAVVNHAPTLSSGGVSPSSGDTDTTFAFSVTYTDPDNDAPTVKKVYIDGTSHDMSSTDTTYTDGALFTYSAKLPKGDHTYYFESSDGTETARLPVSGTYSGPSVSEKPSKPGFIPGIGIIGTTLALLAAALIIYKKRRK